MRTTFEEELIFELFDKWTESLSEGAEDETLQKFMERNNVARSAPISMMFASFLGGMHAGFNLFDAMNGEAKKES